MTRVKAFAAVALAAAASGVAFAGCESNLDNLSAKSLANKIIDHADKVCAERNGTANIAWMEGRSDDVVITCKDGTNHFYDG